MKRILAAASIAAVTIAANSASAAIILSVGQFGGTGVHSDPGLSAATVTGTAGGDLVTISTTGDLLDTSGGGESVFTAHDGLMNDLSIDFAKAYDAITFNLRLPSQTTSTMTLSVNDGAFTFDLPPAFAALANGENKFQLIASGADSIRSLDFTFGTGVADVRQIRVGDVVSLVPEPTSWAMMLLGFGGLGSLLRRRRASPFAARQA